MERKKQATIKQFGYLIFLLESQKLVFTVGDIEKFEKIVKKDLFKLSKSEISELIDKLKSDPDWMVAIYNQIQGTN